MRTPECSNAVGCCRSAASRKTGASNVLSRKAAFFLSNSQENLCFSVQRCPQACCTASSKHCKTKTGPSVPEHAVQQVISLRARKESWSNACTSSEQRFKKRLAKASDLSWPPGSAESFRNSGRGRGFTTVSCAMDAARQCGCDPTREEGLRRQLEPELLRGIISLFLSLSLSLSLLSPVSSPPSLLISSPPTPKYTHTPQMGGENN